MIQKGILAVLWGTCLLAVSACHRTPSAAEVRLKHEQAANHRIDWNMQTLVAAYTNGSNTSPNWDDAAVTALTEFARARAKTLDPDEPWAGIIYTNTQRAMAAGCTDPLVRYLYARFGMPATASAEKYVETFCKIAADMEQTTYPGIRKFYADAASAGQLVYAYGTNANDHPEMASAVNWMGGNLAAALADTTMPAEEAADAAQRAMDVYYRNKAGYRQTYDFIEGPLFKNWPNESSTWLFKGTCFIEMAWKARGSGYADSVSKEGWKEFVDKLKVAESSLNRAWELNPSDPHIAFEMIRVAIGAEKDREFLDLWFNRAMSIDPNCYDACHNKLHYLYPQWYGSRDDMLRFGRECVASTNWGGHVPLILSDAHWEYWRDLSKGEEKDNYWKQPEVWPDVKSSYERFFELNPTATGFYHNYAWFAYKCEQWDKLNELIPKLGTINYAYFGGKDEYDKMVRLAEQHRHDAKTAGQN